MGEMIGALSNPSALAIVAALFGACVGSFLNVCIYRLPRGLSVVHPRSRCSTCGNPIAWYDNLPLVSWWVLRGRCRACGAPFSIRYWVVEALTAGLWAALAWTYGWSIHTLVYCVAVAGMILATFVDLDAMYIPDRVSLGGGSLALIASALWPDLHDTHDAWEALIRSAVGAALGAGLLGGLGWLGTRLFGEEAMGLGDVKLMGAIGALVGWRGVLFTFFVSACAGAVVGLTLVATGRRQLRSAIPFGPFLSFATVWWLLGGEWLWNRYWWALSSWAHSI
jgi:leader peptidase (prepilin peptidase)/N-methyltransferase